MLTKKREPAVTTVSQASSLKLASWSHDLNPGCLTPESLICLYRSKTPPLVTTKGLHSFKLFYIFIRHLVYATYPTVDSGAIWGMALCPYPRALVFSRQNTADEKRSFSGTERWESAGC